MSNSGQTFNDGFARLFIKEDFHSYKLPIRKQTDHGAEQANRDAFQHSQNISFSGKTGRAARGRDASAPRYPA